MKKIPSNRLGLDSLKLVLWGVKMWQTFSSKTLLIFASVRSIVSWLGFLFSKLIYRRINIFYLWLRICIWLREQLHRLLKLHSDWSGTGEVRFLFLPSKIFVIREERSVSPVMFQCTFAATCATIVSGSIAERGNFNGYIIFAMLITGVVYPIQVSWEILR